MDRIRNVSLTYRFSGETLRAISLYVLRILTMKSLQKSQAGQGVQLREVPVPQPGSGEVLIRVQSVGVCGTDLHIDAWTPNYHFMTPALPVTLGHEFSGVVHALGEGVQGLSVNQVVAVRPSVTCGVCVACQQGRFDDCTDRRGIGVMRDGAFAEWVRAPARNCVRIPEGVDAEVAALAEPLTVSLEAARVGAIAPGDRVLILGPGNIGQGIALFARAAGAKQVVIAGHDDAPRLEVLRRMGFGDVVDFAQSGGMDAGLAPYLAQGRFDVVLEATGAPAVIPVALRALKVRGVLVIAGIHAAPVAVDLTALVRNHQQIRGSYRAPEQAWPEVVAFMQEHQETLRHMITHRLPLDQAITGFDIARRKQATKVMVQPALTLGGA